MKQKESLNFTEVGLLTWKDISLHTDVWHGKCGRNSLHLVNGENHLIDNHSMLAFMAQRKI